MPDAGPHRGRGVQSVVVSYRILQALARGSGPMQLTDLAGSVQMAPAKVHRYLVSFVETGMVQHRRSGTYDLGPAAAALGLAALARVDPVNSAADALPGLVEATGLSALLTVWGSQGPTIVRWEKSARPIITTLGLGSVLPVTRSATGQIFAAYLPDRITASAIALEDPAFDLATCRADILTAGLVMRGQGFIPGLWALAAPVRDASGALVAAVSMISDDSAAVADPSAARTALRHFTGAPP